MRRATGLVLVCVASVAHAGDPTVMVDIPAEPLGRALAQLARQTGVDLGTADPALQMLPVRAVHGRMTAEAALRQLLQGTIAVAHRDRAGFWRIERRPMLRRALPPTQTHDVPPADIIVTATKRGTPLDLFPGTASVLSGDALATDGVPADSDAIAQRVPSVGSTHFGPGRNKLFVRGVIDSGFTGPSQATTGQYLDDTRLTYNAPDPDLRLYDIARVEVLEGPQGTLYGAGSLGGVIHIVTARPELDRVAASGAGGLSSTAHGDPGGDLAAMLNVPLATDRLGVRLVGYVDRDGGYIGNPLLNRTNINGLTTVGARATVRARLGAWTIDVGGVWQAIDGDDSPWTDGGAGVPILTRATPTRLGYDDDYVLADGTVSRRWGDLDLVSSTAWVRQSVTEHYDAGTGGVDFMVTQHARTTMLVNETRLSRRGADGSGWVVGVSLLDNHSLLGRIGSDPIGETTPRERADNRVREATAFGEADLPLAARLIATVGARLTVAEVRGDARIFIEPSTIPIFGSPEAAAGTHTERRVLPSLALAWKALPAVRVFARYQQGFRPGGFGISGIRGRSYDGDHIATIEAGARYAALSGRFDLSASGAWTRWRDILAEVVSQGGDPITENIGDGQIRSFEARFDWRPFPGLQLGGGVFLNTSRLTDTRVTSVVVAGQALPNVPRVGAQGNADYGFALSDRLQADFSANLRYFGGSRIGAGPVLDAAQGNYLDDQLALRVGTARAGVSLSITNLQDGAANRFAFGTPYRLYDPQATPQQPRTIRIGFDTKM